MRYFVHAEDGNTYGPADVGMLNRWIEEGRLLPAMMLEEEGTKHRVAAASIGGLDFYALDDQQQPTEPGAVAVMAYESPVQESVAADLFLAWSMVVVTLALAPVRNAGGYIAMFTAVLGMMAAMKAKERGHSGGGAALVLNLVALFVWLCARVYMTTR